MTSTSDCIGEASLYEDDNPLSRDASLPHQKGRTSDRAEVPTRLGEEYSVVQGLPWRAPEVARHAGLRSWLEDVQAVRHVEADAADDLLLRAAEGRVGKVRRAEPAVAD